MARTTRSAAALEKPVEQAASKSTRPNRKRKRTSMGDSDAPPAKQARSDDEVEEDGDIETAKEDEDDEELNAHGEGSSVVMDQDLTSTTGDLPVRVDDARKILEILEMTDTQGLLDRVFPLPDETSRPSFSSPSKSRGDSVSLRVMLREPDEYPLRALRSAISQLLPISSQPRSKTSQTAQQQLKFCQMALSLIDQASMHAPEDKSHDLLEMMFPESSSSTRGASIERRRKYALMQTLPSGEWWTSLNSDALSSDGALINELGTGNADVVSIFPAPSAMLEVVPTLGELILPKKQHSKARPPTQRRLKGGYCLDYGAFASFAPTFDSEGAEVGRLGLNDTLWRKFEKGKARERAVILRKQLQDKQRRVSETEHIEVEEGEKVSGAQGSSECTSSEKRRDEEKEKLSSLLGSSSANALESAMDGLELEERVNDILNRNSRLLLRVEELQVQRLGGKDGGSSEVKVGSEEWEIAQRLRESFELLTAMRPRLPSKVHSAIMPPASVLHALHKILPWQPTHGWYGTLVEGRGIALRGDSTIYMPTSSAPAVKTITLPPANVAPAPPPVAKPAAQYSQQPTYPQQPNYQYSTYHQQYRGYAPYANHNQQSAYYAGAPYGNSNPNGLQQAAGGAAGGQPSQYGWPQSYSPYMAPGGASSGRGTPQPQATGMPASYSSYNAPNGVAAPMPALAVANTVMGTTGKQPNGWTTPGGSYPPLPPHMRGAAGSPAVVGSPLAGYGQGYGTPPVH